MLDAAPNSEMSMALTTAKLFQGFRFKAKANSKEHAGSFNDNFQKMLEGMGQMNQPGMGDAHAMMAQLNGEKFKNWEACLQYFRDNKDHANLNDAKKALNDFPFVRDFIDCTRNHAVADANLSVFFNNCQVTMASKTKGFGNAFNEAW